MRAPGFTLLEILIALSIFAVLAVALTGQSARQLVGSREVELQQAGTLLAENELNRVLARKTWPPLGSAEYAAGYGRARFTVRVVSTGTDYPLLRRIEVSVQAGAEGGAGQVLASLVGFKGQYLD